jgi:hypothetical protein
VCVRLHQRAAVAPGQAVALTWPLERLHVFDTASGQRIRPGRPSAAEAAPAPSEQPLVQRCGAFDPS